MQSSVRSFVLVGDLGRERWGGGGGVALRRPCCNGTVETNEIAFDYQRVPFQFHF